MSPAVVIGESLVDVVGATRHPGGSPLNVAVGLARLGRPALLYTRIGADRDGRLIRDHLDASGVALGDESVLGSRTSTATVEVDAAGRAAYEFDLVRELPRAGVARASLVHAGSIGAVVEPGATAVREAIERADASALLSFDPNARPAVMGSRDEVVTVVEWYARRVHVLKLSDEDAAWLYPGDPLERVLERLAALGVRLAVVTRGGDGCLALAAGRFVARGALPVRLVDTIGAGDAFMSGLLAGLLGVGTEDAAGARPDGAGLAAAARLAAGESLASSELERVLDTALASAAVTVSRAGANPPDPEELREALTTRRAG